MDPTISKWLSFIFTRTQNPVVLCYLRYTVSCTVTFLFGLGLLWVLTSVFGIYYLVSATIAYFAAVSVNYVINRSWVFRNNGYHPFFRGYLIWGIITVAGLFINLALLAFFVELLSLHYITARIIAAIVVGIFGFYMNARYNFKLL